ncbi:MAG: hypothetical protein GWP17_06245, partial [Aquificales bacterium]|nr:hypothetical protein [Aquificales bacterium]
VFFARYMKGLRQTEPVVAEVEGDEVVVATAVSDQQSAPDDYASRIEQELKEE